MELLRHLAETRGFFTRAEALDCGYEDRDLARGLRSRHYVRLRHGSYSYADLWDPLSSVRQHLVRAASVLHGIRGQAALSHVSGALAHGMAVWGLPLDRVHVTRLDGGVGRIEGDIVHHRGQLGRDEPSLASGMPAMPADRCAIEAGIVGSPESALVVLDSYLHLALGSYDDLFGRFTQMARWPRTRHLHVPVRMADAGADGPGESRGRWLFRSTGIPAPIVQHPVYDGPRLVGTCDWGWPNQGVLGEFDGRIKYTRLVPPGSEPGDVVFAEKRREDELREITGWPMVRLVWADLDRPRLTSERVWRALRRAG